MRRPLLLLLCFLSGCLSDERPSGLRRTPDGDGPQVVFTLKGGPVPDVPFPNDVLTRPDPEAPTGLRLNLSTVGATEAESRNLQEGLKLDGFGTFAPITVRFDKALDVKALRGRGRPYAQDPVLLVNLTPGPHFAERVPLDLGRGLFPASVADPQAYLEHDPRGAQGNLLFETVDEDLDGDGVFQELEDTDADDVLDQPNLIAGETQPDVDLLTFYERETHTLILRPVIPLRPGQTYAVVLTEAVQGEDGAPIRSPFEFVHHTQQTQALSKLALAIGPHGVDVNQVAFAWTFTTQTATRELHALRAGLHGEGLFTGLAALYPPDVSRVERVARSDEAPALLQGPALATALAALTPLLDAEGDPAALVATYDAVDYVVAGRFVSPYLLNTTSSTFVLDEETGEVAALRQEVPFLCAVPKGPHDAPFPVVVFGHDLGGSRVELLAFAGRLARWGFASCALDATGHGLSPERVPPMVLPELPSDYLQPFRSLLPGTRASDVDADGRLESGADAFSATGLESRDRLRQTAVDWLQFVRVLRGFDGQRRWSQRWVKGGLAGDFDGDGQIDFGGPAASIHLMGVGYGGVMAAMVGGLEPEVSAVAPLFSGGGLSDLAVRSAHPCVTQGLVSTAMGPLVVGTPTETGDATSVSFSVVDPEGPIKTRGLRLPFAELPPLVPGDLVTLTNLETSLSQRARVDTDGAFRVAVSTDEGDRLSLQVQDSGGFIKSVVDRFELTVSYRGRTFPELDAFGVTDDALVAIESGPGLKRQTPPFRRFIQLLQIQLEAADPLNYARGLIQEPVDAEGRDGRPGTDVLLVLSPGDPEYPVSTGLALARAIGLLEPEAPAIGHGQTIDTLLAAQGVTLGLARAGALVDPDDLSDGISGAASLKPPIQLTREGASLAALRFLYVDAQGRHGPGLAKAGQPWAATDYLGNLVGRFFKERTAAHEPCLLTGDCATSAPGLGEADSGAEGGAADAGLPNDATP